LVERRLIEETFQLQKVSADTRHEKNIRHGHPSTRSRPGRRLETADHSPLSAPESWYWGSTVAGAAGEIPMEALLRGCAAVASVHVRWSARPEMPT
jgi:hypothetical protein